MYVFGANTIAYNVTNDTVLNGSLESPEVSIASITKLMTVYTILKSEQDLTETLKVISPRTPNTILSKGMELSRKDLLELALVSSDNLAAITLGENYPGGTSAFVEKMNFYAKDIGLNNSFFVEPTGLNAGNHSTMADVVKLTNIVSEFEIVKNAAQLTNLSLTHEVSDKKKKKKRKLFTNPTSSYFGKQGIITIKTGFTKAAGFCITMLVTINDKLYNVVVLGAKTKQERQKLVEKMLKTIYNA